MLHKCHEQEITWVDVLFMPQYVNVICHKLLHLFDYMVCHHCYRDCVILASTTYKYWGDMPNIL